MDGRTTEYRPWGPPGEEDPCPGVVGSLRRCCWSPPTRGSRSTIPVAAIPSGRPGSQAVLEGLRRRRTSTARCGALAPRTATRAELERVHDGGVPRRARGVLRGGRRRPRSPTPRPRAASWDAAVLAAGAGLAAIEALERGDGDAAFCAVRPPGHHARRRAARWASACSTTSRSPPRALRDHGERVLIVDWDAHHGNGTQDMFFDDPDVMYVSMHEWPLYPGTGRLDDDRRGRRRRARPSTSRSPPARPATSTSHAIDTVVAPLAERFAPDWVLVSAGYDAHRADPLTGLGLHGGRLRRPDRPGASDSPRPGGSSCSSRAATTSTPCATRSPRRRRPWSAGRCGPNRPPPAGPGARGGPCGRSRPATISRHLAANSPAVRARDQAVPADQARS